MMIGGLGGVFIQEMVVFTYWTVVYAVNYKPKK
ncbi:hypothetical protein P799_01005 [Lysinibacillus sphaericus CBAM5]|uniref:Uncharacterized protein n=3 Tax=Lysinibacillus sphaericus TaxID=1421 RepID=W7RWV7_LYSSH|nr:hypothetical protein P799_01005 [Lysinibacillus sphaericus CBAM5]